VGRARAELALVWPIVEDIGQEYGDARLQPQELSAFKRTSHRCA